MRLLALLLLAAAALAQEPRQLSLQDHSKNLVLKRGDKLAVRLPANPTSGYQWQLFYKNSQLKRLGQPSYQPTNPKKPQLGGSVTYTFQVGGEFDDSLELRYIRPKVAKPKPLRTFLVHLRVASEDS